MPRILLEELLAEAAELPRAPYRRQDAVDLRVHRASPGDAPRLDVREVGERLRVGCVRQPQSHDDRERTEQKLREERKHRLGPRRDELQ